MIVQFIRFVLFGVVFMVFYTFWITSQPSTIQDFIPCDLDGDKDCDDTDKKIFNMHLGECIDGYYNELADADHDGCITEKDYNELFG